MKYDPYEELARERRERARQDEPWARRSDAFLAWLRARPRESWGFFIAGLVIGGFLL